MSCFIAVHRNQWSAIALVLIIIPAIRAQTIAIDSRLRAPELGSVIMMPIHCDSSGNIFLAPPLSKIGLDGRRSATFDSSAAQQDHFTDLILKSFAVDSNGSVYQLAKTTDQRPVVVKFDGDGQYKGTVVLNQPFEPHQLAVFSDGTFLVAGVTLAHEGSSPPEFTTYIAVFDASGRFLKQVDTSEATYTPNARALAGTKGASTSSGSAPPELGIAESDGTNAYLLRQGSNPTVFVISAAGVIDRKLTLSPPPYPDTQVGALRIGAGQMLVEYAQPHGLPNGHAAHYLVLYDLSDGARISEYSRGPDVIGDFGCPDWKGGFSFLGADHGGRILLKASVR